MVIGARSDGRERENERVAGDRCRSCGLRRLVGARADGCRHVRRCDKSRAPASNLLAGRYDGQKRPKQRYNVSGSGSRSKRRGRPPTRHFRHPLQQGGAAGNSARQASQLSVGGATRFLRSSSRRRVDDAQVGLTKIAACDDALTNRQTGHASQDYRWPTANTATCTIGILVCAWASYGLRRSS